MTAMLQVLQQTFHSLRSRLIRLYRLNQPMTRRGIWRPLGVAWLDRPMADFDSVRAGAEALARHRPCRRSRC
jgi:hypothetical protein